MIPRASLIPAVLGLCWANPAAALDADTFKPSGSAYDGRYSLQLVHPEIGFKGAFYGGLGIAWSDDPIVKTTSAECESAECEQAVVHSLFATRLAAGYNIAGVARLDLEVPFYPYAGAPDADWSGAAMGDMRLGGVLPVYRHEEDLLGIAFAPVLSLPTGNDLRYTGSSGAELELMAALAGRAGALGWDFNTGVSLGGQDELGQDVAVGSTLDNGLGFTLSASDSFLLGTEITSAITLREGLGSWQENPMEGHLYGSYASEEGLVVTAGAGRGLVAGIGAPDLRLFMLISYRTLGNPPVYDQDGDGILDEVDKCVEEAEDMDNYKDKDGCPEPDNDGDGILDQVDQCPRQAEDVDGFKDIDGCPDPDNDGDLVLDSEDECPKVAGTLKTKGCPDQDGDLIIDGQDDCPSQVGPSSTKGCPDRDKDRVPDFRDKCPDEACHPRADPKRSDGCPKRVVVTASKIEILDKIHFETGNSKIKRQSFELLGEIAQVFKDNPGIKLVEVAGHTDSQGGDQVNQKLSQARAEAVMRYLIKPGGVAPARLKAKGYGETSPVAGNDTADGRAANRRVEFKILK